MRETRVRSTGHRPDTQGRPNGDPGLVQGAGNGSPDGPASTTQVRSKPVRQLRSWLPTRLTAIKVAVFVAIASIVLGGTAFAAATLYAQYGAVKNVPNAEAWAALEPRYVGQAACGSCHEPEVAAQDASAHIDVSCESCHGPGAGHSLSDEAAREVSLTEPESEICSTCHATTAGRPATYPQVEVDEHYEGGECLRCHDPHSIVAVRPPDITHPRAKLPDCITCHAPDGLKEIPSGHEPVADRVCLSCHGRVAEPVR
jgi:hypothetical protein